MRRFSVLYPSAQPVGTLAARCRLLHMKMSGFIRYLWGTFTSLATHEPDIREWRLTTVHSQFGLADDLLCVLIAKCSLISGLLIHVAL